jgi:hypothetical protein
VAGRGGGGTTTWAGAGEGLRAVCFRSGLLLPPPFLLLTPALLFLALEQKKPLPFGQDPGLELGQSALQALAVGEGVPQEGLLALLFLPQGGQGGEEVLPLGLQLPLGFGQGPFFFGEALEEELEALPLLAQSLQRGLELAHQVGVLLRDVPHPAGPHRQVGEGLGPEEG